VKVKRDGTRTYPIEGLDRPSSVVVDCRGTVYVTNKGLSLGEGEVIRLGSSSSTHHRCD
jgi:hypothetical protein